MSLVGTCSEALVLIPAALKLIQSPSSDADASAAEEVLDAIAQLVCEGSADSNEEAQEECCILVHATGHRQLRNILDGPMGGRLAEKLLAALKDKLADWACHNRSAFVIVKLVEGSNKKVAKAVKRELLKNELMLQEHAEGGIAGCKLLCKVRAATKSVLCTHYPSSPLLSIVLPSNSSSTRNRRRAEHSSFTLVQPLIAKEVCPG